MGFGVLFCVRGIYQPTETTHRKKGLNVHYVEGFQRRYAILFIFHSTRGVNNATKGVYYVLWPCIFKAVVYLRLSQKKKNMIQEVSPPQGQEHDGEGELVCSEPC